MSEQKKEVDSSQFTELSVVFKMEESEAINYLFGLLNKQYLVDEHPPADELYFPLTKVLVCSMAAGGKFQKEATSLLSSQTGGIKHTFIQKKNCLEKTRTPEVPNPSVSFKNYENDS